MGVYSGSEFSSDESSQNGRIYIPPQTHEKLSNCVDQADFARGFDQQNASLQSLDNFFESEQKKGASPVEDQLILKTPIDAEHKKNSLSNFSEEDQENVGFEPEIKLLGRDKLEQERDEFLELMNQGNNKMGSYSGSSEISENEKEDFSPNQQAETLKKLNFLED